MKHPLAHAACVLALAAPFGCNLDRALPLVLVDAGARPEADLATPVDLEPPARPCHLEPAGTPVETIGFTDTRSTWHSAGLLGSGGRRVLHYGSVQLRFGGWSDAAIYAREYDVTSWPPTPVTGPLEIYWSFHNPVYMFEAAPQRLGAVWWTDTDGVGPRGVQYRTLAAGTATLSPHRFLSQDSQLRAAPLPLGDGSHFAVLYTPPDGDLKIGVFSPDGTPVREQSFPVAAAAQGILSVGRIGQESFVLLAGWPCAADMAPCPPNAIELHRLDGGVARPLTVEKVTSIAAPLGDGNVGTIGLLSDGISSHFVTWIESGQTRSTLYAMPLDSRGAQAGPIEVWFSTQGTLSANPRGASVGPLGVIYPVATLVPSDMGRPFELHLLQRQLVERAPILDTTFVVLATWHVFATVQLDEPRALIVGYSAHLQPPPLDRGGPGFLARYVCAED